MTVVSGELSVVGGNTGAKLMSGKILVWLLATVLLTTASRRWRSSRRKSIG
jgi:hypothetical protein